MGVYVSSNDHENFFLFNNIEYNMNRIEFIKYGTLGIGAILTGCTIEEIEECPPQPLPSGSIGQVN